MVLPNSADHRSVVKENFDVRLFTRRDDLTDAIRLEIATNALHAMMNRVWGTITNLADQYNISRTFVYSLAQKLKEVGTFLFQEATEFVPNSSPREVSIEMMLSLRLVGKVVLAQSQRS